MKKLLLILLSSFMIVTGITSLVYGDAHLFDKLANKNASNALVRKKEPSYSEVLARIVALSSDRLALANLSEEQIHQILDLLLQPPSKNSKFKGLPKAPYTLTAACFIQSICFNLNHHKEDLNNKLSTNLYIAIRYVIDHYFPLLKENRHGVLNLAVTHGVHTLEKMRSNLDSQMAVDIDILNQRLEEF